MRRLVVLAVLVAGACSSSRPAPVLDRGSVVAAQAAPQSAPQGGAQAPRSPVRSGAASGTGTASNAGPSAAQAAPAVQVNPVAGVGSIESRPIESRPAAARGPGQSRRGRGGRRNSRRRPHGQRVAGRPCRARHIRTGCEQHGGSQEPQQTPICALRQVQLSTAQVSTAAQRNQART